MYKLVTKNIKLLTLFNKYKIFRSIFVFDITFLSMVDDTELYNSVISSYSNNNNTSKFTYPGRFNDINKIIISILSNSKKKYLLHDVAISTGITTYELYNCLKKNNNDFHITGSDLYAEIYYQGNNIKYFYDKDGSLIQIYFFNIFCSLKITNIFFLSKMLFIILKRNSNTAINKIIYLFDKNFKDLITNNEIKFISYDLFTNNEKEKTKYDLIRAMNILNLVYFNENEIRFALKKLKNSLNINGILLIGRTNSNGINNATFYKLNDNSNFEILQKVNNGYEFNYLLENL
jgi:chemotaxis methyl-accepting protein methylase